MDKNKRNKIINVILDVINALLTVTLIKVFFRSRKNDKNRIREISE